MEKEQPLIERVAQDEFCVYIGPTIRSVAQRNTIFPESRNAVLEKLSASIEKYPPITQLIVSGKELAEARTMIKQQGNRINEAYKRLIRLL